MTERASLNLLHCKFKRFEIDFISFFFEHVNSSDKKDIRKTVAKKISEVALVVIYSILSHLKKKVSYWKAFLKSGLSNDFLNFSLFSLNKIIDEWKLIGLNIVEVLRNGRFNSL